MPRLRSATSSPRTVRTSMATSAEASAAVRKAFEKRASAVSTIAFKFKSRPPRRPRSSVNASAASWTARDVPGGTSQEATTSPRGYPSCGLGGKTRQDRSRRFEKGRFQDSSRSSSLSRGALFFFPREPRETIEEVRDRGRDEDGARAVRRRRARGVDARAKKRAFVRDTPPARARAVGPSANANARSLVVPAVPRSRVRSRRRGGRARFRI